MQLRSARKTANKSFFESCVAIAKEEGEEGEDLCATVREMCLAASTEEFDGDVERMLAEVMAKDAQEKAKEEKKTKAAKKKVEEKKKKDEPAAEKKKKKKKSPVEAEKIVLKQNKKVKKAALLKKVKKAMRATKKSSHYEEPQEGDRYYGYYDLDGYWCWYDEDYNWYDEDENEENYEQDYEPSPKRAKKREREPENLDYDSRLTVNEKQWEGFDDDIKRALLQGLKKKEANSYAEHHRHDDSTLQYCPQNALLESSWRSAQHAKDFLVDNYERWINDHPKFRGNVPIPIKEDITNQVRDLLTLIDVCKSNCFGEDKVRNFNPDDAAACFRFNTLAKATMALLIRFENRNFSRPGAAKEIEKMFGSISLPSEDWYKPGKMRAEYVKIKDKLPKARYFESRQEGYGHYGGPRYGRNGGRFGNRPRFTPNNNGGGAAANSAAPKNGSN